MRIIYTENKLNSTTINNIAKTIFCLSYGMDYYDEFGYLVQTPQPNNIIETPEADYKIIRKLGFVFIDDKIWNKKVSKVRVASIIEHTVITLEKKHKLTHPESISEFMGETARSYISVKKYGGYHRGIKYKRSVNCTTWILLPEETRSVDLFKKKSRTTPGWIEGMNSIFVRKLINQPSDIKNNIATMPTCPNSAVSGPKIYINSVFGISGFITHTYDNLKYDYCRQIRYSVADIKYPIYKWIPDGRKTENELMYYKQTNKNHIVINRCNVKNFHRKRQLKCFGCNLSMIGQNYRILLREYLVFDLCIECAHLQFVQYIMRDTTAKIFTVESCVSMVDAINKIQCPHKRNIYTQLNDHITNGTFNECAKFDGSVWLVSLNKYLLVSDLSSVDNISSDKLIYHMII
jgi:hypothetical protein